MNGKLSLCTSRNLPLRYEGVVCSTNLNLTAVHT